MNEEQNMRETLVRYWLERSQESLESARSELAANRLGFTVNRLYYAMFYAVTAALSAKGENMSKHAGVQAAFHRQFVKTGMVDVKYGKLYKRLFDDRQQADYAPLPVFDREEIENRMVAMAAFLSEFEGVVMNLLDNK